MSMYTVAFLGHRQIDDPLRLEERLEALIRDLVREKEYVNFLVGRNGEFDQCVASAVRRVHKNYRDDNSALVLVLPYLTAEYRKNENAFHRYYTGVELSQAAVDAHPRAAIRIRNREMVDRADLVICYLQKEQGGAWQAVKYAGQQGKPILNLAE
ncbi:MAG: hypothetical protein E7541_06695 [Ruminococcaceae bacterium]|nr:hypothetical protein [Oscillospiraceae bacterium]